MKIKGIVHVGIIVENIEKAMEFYCGVLGLEVDAPPCDWVTDYNEVHAMGIEEDYLHRIASLKTPEGSLIELVEYEEGKAVRVPDADLPTCLGKHHISFRVDDINGWVEELAKHGIKPFRAPMAYETDAAEGGVAYWMQFRDPYGVIIEMMQQ